MQALQSNKIQQRPSLSEQGTHLAPTKMQPNLIDTVSQTNSQSKSNSTIEIPDQALQLLAPLESEVAIVTVTTLTKSST